MAPSPDQSVNLIEGLSRLSSRLSLGDDPQVRNEALRLSRQLTASLEQPENTAVDLAFSPFIAVAARIAVGLDLFKYISRHDGPGEELLIILRPLASVRFVNEVSERTWEATPITKAMATEEIATGHRTVGEMVVGAATKAPKWLEEAGYRCPTDPRDGFMQYAFQTKLTAFQLFSSMPDILKDFNTFMGNTMGARGYWVDWFPVHKRIIDGADGESALLVDVGGGKGHDLVAFQAKFPGQGPLVLQDLGATSASANHRSGARSYFYHHILHDWTDQKCLEILGPVAKAMKPGYSKLLLHEMIIPEQGASTFHGVLDMTMMAFNAGMERSERQWEELLDKAGL
ncbi:S-adenosyl-L-methionine-dependent methyltransferase [Hypoxylon sp. NC1633]|nr:S-adenosyl-L-methionine-dependent methyltransferase [Hypoxylon sp. NC1633]